MKHLLLHTICIAAMLGATACVPSEVTPDPDATPASPDAGPMTEDGGPGPMDASDLDAGAQDAAAPDATVPDAMPAPDAAPVLDDDNDGIPNDEDPEPNRNNPLLLEDTFESTEGDWVFSSVSMRIDPARSILEVDRIEPFEREGWVGPRPAWADYFIRSLIRVDSVGTSQDARSGHAGIIARASQVTPSRYVTCGVDLKQGRIVLAEHEGVRETTLGEAPTSAAAGTWLLLNFTALRNAYVCEIGGVRVEGASAIFDFGSVGFRSFDATFASDWIEVYEILP